MCYVVVVTNKKTTVRDDVLFCGISWFDDGVRNILPRRREKIHRSRYAHLSSLEPRSVYFTKKYIDLIQRSDDDLED